MPIFGLPKTTSALSPALLVLATQETAKSELPAAQMKLIHSGKVLKDGDTIESCNIKETDFLVVMITKAKKAPAPAPAPAAEAAAPAPAAAPAAAAESSSAPAPAPAAAAPAAAAPAPAAAAAAAPAPAAAAAAASEEEEFPAEMVGNLTAMGFPEAEVKACLRASGGNPDVAVEVSWLDCLRCWDNMCLVGITNWYFNNHTFIWCCPLNDIRMHVPWYSFSLHCTLLYRAFMYAVPHEWHPSWSCRGCRRSRIRCGRRTCRWGQ